MAMRGSERRPNPGGQPAAACSPCMDHLRMMALCPTLCSGCGCSACRHAPVFGAGRLTAAVVVVLLRNDCSRFHWCAWPRTTTLIIGVRGSSYLCIYTQQLS
ncbi:hypothetical protein SORBI_3001G158966 [Sorghum bicolor]|uniref:Uncharacterized protein n=1 Tax=Sorghum bicolor TaxID=4558 RepID=A0A1Z5S5T8_SORBI|nr:hypothetical protein SORBI_3001G158966 [Sorghum bicolor]